MRIKKPDTRFTPKLGFGCWNMTYVCVGLVEEEEKEEEEVFTQMSKI